MKDLGLELTVQGLGFRYMRPNKRKNHMEEKTESEMETDVV